MNFARKNIFSTLLCCLVLTAATITAGEGEKKSSTVVSFLKSFVPAKKKSIVITSAQDFKDKKDQLVKGAVIDLKADFSYEAVVPQCAGVAGTFKKEKYQVALIGVNPQCADDLAIVFHPVKSTQPLQFAAAFAAYISKDQVEVGLTESDMALFYS